MKKYLAYISCLMFIMNPNLTKASDDFDDIRNTQGGMICETYTNVMNTVLSLRRDKIMKNSAYSMIDSVMSNHGVNFYMFLKGSIDSAYSNPDKFEESLNNGTWLVKCAKVVNGF